jgi:hypothetical protein
MDEILNQVARLTPAERVDMQMKGLSPLNPQHVKRYKSGQGNLSLQEKQERAQVLFAGTENLGSGGERDIDGMSLVGRAPEEVNGQDRTMNTVRNLRQNLNEDFERNDVPISNNSISSDGLLSLKKSNVKEEAKKYGKNYINAFIINLQTNTTQSRVDLFKHLKAALEKQNSYKGSKVSFDQFSQGLTEIEQTMLEQLSSGGE